VTTVLDRLPLSVVRSVRAAAQPSCDVCGYSRHDGILLVSDVAGLIPPATGFRSPAARRNGLERVRGAWITRLCDGCATRLRVRDNDGARDEDDVQPRWLRRGRRA